MVSTSQDRSGQFNTSTAIKSPCACAATTNITTLQGEQTIDGVLTSASRVLLTGQTTASQNGVYLTSTGVWVRDSDCDGTNDVVQGTLFPVYGGTANSGIWQLTTASPVIGSTSLAFTKTSNIIASVAMTPVVQAPTLAAGRVALGLGSDIKPQDFRLTLTTGLPVTTADVTGAATIYCSPYIGKSIALYDGTNWNIRTSAQFSLALGTLSSGLPYDAFCYDNAGVPTLEFLAWTNDTTRATALVYQDGVLSKTGALTRRYLGTFYTTATTTTEDSAARRYLFNYYNRLPRSVYATDPAASWNYTTATTRAANANTTYGQGRVGIMTGYAEDAANVTRTSASNNGTVGTGQYSGLGLNSTTVFNGIQALSTSTAIVLASSVYNAILPLGMNYLQALENSAAAGTTTWYGTSGISSASISGISGFCYA